MKGILTLFVAIILTFSISENSYGQKKSKSTKSSSSKTQTVSGYTKKDGTKVKPYKRSPKGSKKKTSSIQRLNHLDSYVLFSKREDELEA